MLIRSLLILAVAANLLVPAFSDWVFFALSFHGNAEIFSLENNISWVGSGNRWAMSSPLSVALVNQVFYGFGEEGLGVLICLISALISILTLTLVMRSVCSNMEKPKTGGVLGLGVMVSILVVGASLYRSDLNPDLFLVLLFLLVLYLRWEAAQSSLVNLFVIVLIPVLLLLALLFDIKALSFPFAILTFHYLKLTPNYSKRQIVSDLSTLGIAFLVSDFFREMALSAFRSTKVFTTAFLLRGVDLDLYSGFISFDVSFLLLLVFVWVVGRKVWDYKSLLLILVSLVLVPVFHSVLFFRELFVLAVAFSIMKRSGGGHLRSELIEGCGKLTEFFSKISVSSRSFFLLSWIFISVISFMKVPMTDYLFPAKRLDSIIDSANCLEHHPIQIGGYVAYRFAHEAKCRPETTIYTLGSAYSEVEVDRYLAELSEY